MPFCDLISQWPLEGVGPGHPFAPPDGDLQGSRLWFEALAAHALRAGDVPVISDLGAAVLPLLRRGEGLRAFTTPYTLAWGPCVISSASAADLMDSGRRLARLVSRRAPVVLEAVDPASPHWPGLLAGFRGGGRIALRFDHFGNWHEDLPPATDWAAYLSARPPALRNTIVRKLARAQRDARFDLIAAAEPTLEEGIAAYIDVRARSWKPAEPAPDLDPALMRLLAPLGLLRLGVLRGADGVPEAVQYWVLDRGGRRATVLKLSHVEAARGASPGTVLTAMMVRHLLDMDGVRELDFGRGDDPYKRLWVTRRRQRIGLALVDPLHPAGMLLAARHLAGAARRGLRGQRRADHLPAEVRT